MYFVENDVACDNDVNLLNDREYEETIMKTLKTVHIRSSALNAGKLMWAIKGLIIYTWQVNSIIHPRGYSFGQFRIPGK